MSTGGDQSSFWPFCARLCPGVFVPTFGYFAREYFYTIFRSSANKHLFEHGRNLSMNQGYELWELLTLQQHILFSKVPALALLCVSYFNCSVYVYFATSMFLQMIPTQTLFLSGDPDHFCAGILEHSVYLKSKLLHLAFLCILIFLTSLQKGPPSTVWAREDALTCSCICRYGAFLSLLRGCGSMIALCQRTGSRSLQDLLPSRAWRVSLSL